MARISIHGGGSGIRTHEGLAPQQTFQICALDHYAIPPRLQHHFSTVASNTD